LNFDSIDGRFFFYVVTGPPSELDFGNSIYLTWNTIMEIKLLASAGDENSIKRLIEKYSFSDPHSVSLSWESTTTSTILRDGEPLGSHYRVIKKNGRFRFERIPEGTNPFSGLKPEKKDQQTLGF